jgi:hypothetical protein
VVILPRERLMTRGMGVDCYDPILQRTRRPAFNGSWRRNKRLSGPQNTWMETAACAWFIVLTVAALFKVSDLVSASRKAPFAYATDLTQMADDIDRWERGELRQRTMTVPHPDRIVLASQVPQ